jgi:hypothetical protein
MNGESGMRALRWLLTFLLVFQALGSVSVAASMPVSWGDTKQANYDTSVPGTTLIWTDPLSQGGMNLTTGKMTRGKDADLVFSSDGGDIGANAIIDLGVVDFNSVNEMPESGYEQLIEAVPGHVYLLQLADGFAAKIKIIRHLNSFITIQYALGEAAVQDLPEGELATYQLSIPGVILINNDPTSQGGINFSKGLMTKNKAETDIAIYNGDIGSRGIIDLGVVDMNEVSYGDVPDSGFSKFADLEVGHVYITVTHDGRFVKFYVAGVYPTEVELVYAFLEEEAAVIESIELIGPDSIGTAPVTLSVIGILDTGDTIQIPNNEVIWTTSDKTVGTISAGGVFKLTGKAGKVTITANYEGLKSDITYETFTLTSIKIQQAFNYSPTPVTLSVLASYSNKKTAVIKGDAVKWTSNNTKVATVNSKGVVTFTGNSGKVTITASYNGRTTSVTTTVGNVVKSLTTSTKLAYSSKPVTIVLTANYSNGKKVKLTKGVTWKSSNTKVATVSSTGVVTFTGQNGEVTITATYQGKTLTLKTTVKIKTDQYAAYYGKWNIRSPFAVKNSGTVTINKDGTYALNQIKGKWRAAKTSEVYGSPESIILINGGGDYDIAIAPHDSKKGYIKLLTDSKGTYTDGTKIWIFWLEGYK